MTYTIQLRRDLAANWTGDNPVLAQGELGIETDTDFAKIGDGSSTWASLSYWSPARLDDRVPAKEAGFAAGSGGNGNLGLVTLLAAIANRDSAACNIPVIGDSITEGNGASTFSKRWVTQATKAIRERYPTTANGSSGGLGFIPMTSTGETTFTWPITNPDSIPGNIPQGPVRGGVNPTSAASFTWTAPAGTTSVKIMYFDASEAGAFSYQVNGGATVPVTNAGTGDGALTGNITITAGQVLTIAWISGNPFIEGIIHYAGDETSGITFHGCGHYGWDTGTGGSGWMQPGYGYDWRLAFAALNPSAIAIDLGTNDAGQWSSAQCQSNLDALITYLRGNSTLANLPILLIIPVFYAQHQDFAAAERNLVAIFASTQACDLNYRIPDASYEGSFYYDAVHPSDLGHALMGEAVAASIQIT